LKQALGDKKINIYLALCGVVFMLIFPFLVGNSSYFMSLFVTIYIYMITSMALNLLVGYGGQISIGTAGFLLVGGYTVAIMGSKFALPFWILLLLAGVVSGLMSLIIGLPAIRLKGHFLALATLGFGLSIPYIALYWESLTKGFMGFAVKRPAGLSSDLQFYYVVVVVTVMITWLLINIVKSGMGRAFVAIRDSEVAAQATGINVAFYKIVMFVISAFFTGIAGGLNAYWIKFVSPADFNLSTSFLLLAMIVVGGLASIPGAIIGAVLFTLIPHFTGTFPGITNLVIGIAIVLILLFRPAGIISLLDLVNMKKEAVPFGEGGVSKNAHL
jgi:branched-chain amino acid transport system permease protein